MNSKHIRFALAAATIATLAACGGGGGGGGDAGDAGDASVAGSSPAAADPIDKYMGTFVSNCRAPDPGVTLSAGGSTLQTQWTWSTPTKVSATKATFVLTLRTYASKDCSGQAYSTLTVPADGNTYMQVDGTATIGTQTVDKMTFGEGVYFPGFSAQTITINGVRYAGSPFTDRTPQTYKNISLLQGNAFYGGDISKPKDAQGYPTVLDTTPSATKQ